MLCWNREVAASYSSEAGILDVVLNSIDARISVASAYDHRAYSSSWGRVQLATLSARSQHHKFLTTPAVPRSFAESRELCDYQVGL